MSGGGGALALGIVGAVVGSFFGMPQLGFMIGSLAGNLLFPPKLPGVEGPRLGDLRGQASQYGRPIPVVYGSTRIAGNVIFEADLREVANSSNQGSKGGGPTQQQTTYSYFADFAVMLTDCQDVPIVGIRRLWDTYTGTVILDAGDNAAVSSLIASQGLADNITVYTGTSTQLPDPMIESHLGVGNVPAYRFRSYIVFTGLNLAKFSNRLPNIEAEVVTEGSIQGLRQIAVSSPAYTVDPAYSSGNFLRPNWPRFADGIFKVLFSRSVVNYRRQFSFDTNAILVGEEPPSTRSHCFLGFLGNNPLNYLAVFYDWEYPSGSINTSRALSVGGKLFVRRNYTTQPDGTFMGACIDASQTRIYILTTLGSGAILSIYDEGVNLLVSGPQSVIPLTIAAGSLTGEIVCGFADAAIAVESDNQHLWYFDTVNHVNVCRINPDASLTVLDSINLSYPHGIPVGMAAAADNGVCAVTHSPSGIDNQNQAMIISRIPVVTNGAAVLSDIVSDLVTKKNFDGDVTLTTADIDVTQLTDSVPGYLFSQQAPARTALIQLAQGFFFDAVESDGKLKFVKRGGNSVITIPDDDLAVHESSQALPAILDIEKQQEIELPSQVTVMYIDKDNSYQIATQQSRRLVGTSGAPMQVQLPICMDANRGKKIVDVMRFEAFASQETYRFATSRKYAYLEPTDIVTVQGREIRIVKRTETPIGVLQFEGALEDGRIYNKNFPAATWAQPPETINLAGPTDLVMMDLPTLRDVDDGGCIYGAAKGFLASWPGCSVYRSPDNNAYLEVISLTTPATIGVAQNVLGNFSGGNIFDESSSLTVTLGAGVLASATALSVMNGANAFALGMAGRFEVGQFKTATLNGDGSYTVTGLLRGRKGTEFAMNQHTQGDAFVLLDANFFRLGESLSDMQVTRFWKGVTIGNLVNDALGFPFIDSGASLKPYSVVFAHGFRNAAHDFTLNWLRRSRIGMQNWTSGIAVPIGETSELYAVEIYSDNTYTTVVRLISGITMPTVIYTSAQQIADFGSNQSTIYYIIYQISALIGRGYPNKGSA